MVVSLWSSQHCNSSFCDYFKRCNTKKIGVICCAQVLFCERISSCASIGVLSVAELLRAVFSRLFVMTA
jgi:hypothetical protein